jgi:hypothetical protein
VKRALLALFCFSFSWSCAALLAQAPVKLTIDTSRREFAIPVDFVGLGFETKSVLPNTYGVSGYFFSPQNKQLITLFRNTGIKNIRVGGGTVDGSGNGRRCATGAPTFKDIDNLFEFAQLAGVKVIYSVRLLNVKSCDNPNLASDDANVVRYIWQKYRTNLDSVSIGNEPDVSEYHSRPGHVVDPSIYETKPGVSGSAYFSYFAAWQRIAQVIHKEVPGAKLSGPEAAVSGTGSFTPDPSEGISWTQQFAKDVKDSGIFKEALQHHYVWGRPGTTTVQEAIDDMLSSAWDDNTSQGMQRANNGGSARYNPYPFVYERVLAPLVSYGVPYRMTEANDCLHGVHGASDGFAAAIWSLDYMHWWAAHHLAGVNFHNNPWLPTDTIVPDPNPCSPSGCENYHVTPKALGMKAFSLGSQGYVEPVAVDNPNKVNLTAYAVGTERELYVTIINKSHTTAHDVTNANVVIEAPDFDHATVDAMVLTDGEPGNADRMTGTLGGSDIPNDAPWDGKWTPLGRMQADKIALTVQSITATVVRIRAVKRQAGTKGQSKGH